MVPPSSTRIPRVPAYSSATSLGVFRIQDYHLLRRLFPEPSSKRLKGKLHRAGSLSLAATNEISKLISFPLYLDVSVPQVRLTPLCIQDGMPAKKQAGFPIQKSPDRNLIADSPKLIAG